MLYFDYYNNIYFCCRYNVYAVLMNTVEINYYKRFSVPTGYLYKYLKNTQHTQIHVIKIVIKYLFFVNSGKYTKYKNCRKVIIKIILHKISQN